MKLSVTHAFFFPFFRPAGGFAYALSFCCCHAPLIATRDSSFFTGAELRIVYVDEYYVPPFYLQPLTLPRGLRDAKHAQPPLPHTHTYTFVEKHWNVRYFEFSHLQRTPRTIAVSGNARDQVSMIILISLIGNTRYYLRSACCWDEIEVELVHRAQ